MKKFTKKVSPLHKINPSGVSVKAPLPQVSICAESNIFNNNLNKLIAKFLGIVKKVFDGLIYFIF